MFIGVWCEMGVGRVAGDFPLFLKKLFGVGLARVGARFAREKQVACFSRNDRQKSNGKDPGLKPPANPGEHATANTEILRFVVDDGRKQATTTSTAWG